MAQYSKLELVKVLPYGWIYYPNNYSVGFTISKGYFTGDEATNVFQIVEDGKSKRPSVLLQNIVVRDESTGGADQTFSSFAELSDRLVFLGCPLAVSQSSSSSGISEVTGTPGEIEVTSAGSTRIIRIDESYTDAIFSAIDSKADDNSVVKLSGNQTIADVKTFLASPIGPIATATNQLANFGQVLAFSTINSKFSRVNSNYTLQQADSGKYILISGNSRTITIPNGLTGEFHITLDIEGTGALIIDDTTTMYGDNTGLDNGTGIGNNYNVPQNGSFYFIRNTVDGRIRTKGDFI